MACPVDTDHVPLSEPRPAQQRKADVLAALSAPQADAWVATSGQGPHLVPLSVHWTGARIVVAVEPSSRTARNLDRTRIARLALGGSRDVVMIDTEVTRIDSDGEIDDDVAERYAAQAGWDPRSSRDGFVYVVLRPTRIQAWREVNELPGRTLLRDGEWLV
jgi:hypothetical protein